jgi:preprotein translocase SecE subunit
VFGPRLAGPTPSSVSRPHLLLEILVSTAIRKFGQGYWTRLLTVIGFGLLGVLGAIWLWRLFETYDFGVPPVYVASGVAMAFMVAVGLVLWWFAGFNPRSVDFLVATEGEMKKVNWSSRREVTTSTGVVIFTMLVIAVFCFFCDQAFAWVFLQMGVLDGSVLEAE